MKELERTASMEVVEMASLALDTSGMKEIGFGRAKKFRRCMGSKGLTTESQTGGKERPTEVKEAPSLATGAKKTWGAIVGSMSVALGKSGWQAVDGRAMK